MTALAAGVLFASLLGSLHCAGMCGPLVAIYAAGPARESPWRKRMGTHAAYALGRLSAYLALGVAAGAAGRVLDRAGALAGIARGAAVISGTLIVAWGVHALLAARGGRVPRIEAPSAMRRWLGGALGAVAGQPPVVRAAILGLGSGLLPCGWLWAFVITAAGTGSAVAGAAVMAVFWCGTLPVMIAVGEAARTIAGPLRRHVPTACALLLVVVGVWTVVGRARAVAPVAGEAATPACHAAR